MFAEIEQNPDVWEKLFPFELRRELARKFVEEAARIPSVVKIVAMQVGKDSGKHHQRIFVMTRGIFNGAIPSQEEMNEVDRAFFEVCPDKTSQDVLGHIPVLTEPLFFEDRHHLYEVRFRKVIVLYQRNREPQNLPEASSTNLNAELN